MCNDMAPNKKLQLRKVVSGIVFWSGLIIIGIIAIPTGILFAIIFIVWRAIDFVIKKIEKD